MEFTVRIICDNAAFEGEKIGFEVSRILDEARDKIEDGAEEGVLIDINGNLVGNFCYSDDLQEHKAEESD